MCDNAPKTNQRNPEEICLKEICFQAVRKHFAALRTEAVLDLPTPLIQDLLPHLTVCQLDELQPPLNQRGISTHSGWIGILQQLPGANRAIDFNTEEDAKHEVMRVLFPLVLYGYKNLYVSRNITNLNTPSFLLSAAKCVKQFLLTTPFDRFIAEQRPLLNLLERRIWSVNVSHNIDLSKRKIQIALYVLHRLLDHGVAKKIVVHTHCPIVLAWLLHGRGSQYINPELKNLMHSKKAGCFSQAASASADGASCSPCLQTRASVDQDVQVTPCKRFKLDSLSAEEEESGKVSSAMDPQGLCQTFTPSDDFSAGPCPQGQIECLEIGQCGTNSLRVLNSALPTFFCLRSLILHSFGTFWCSVVLGLARALKQLSDSSRSSLTDLSISILPQTSLVEILLDASPNIMSLHVEIQTVMWVPGLFEHDPRPAGSDMSELSLEKLVIKVSELQQTDLHLITSVLRRSPHLTSLHVAGMRLPAGTSQSQLLTTLLESNHFLRSLSLEDMNLSDCLPQILSLLRDCKLEDHQAPDSPSSSDTEAAPAASPADGPATGSSSGPATAPAAARGRAPNELQLKDCRLLEKRSNKEESLQQLVAAVKTVPSLHTLSLAQNRLARNVCVLAELFSESSPSSVKRLDISSNFIQPAELLEFAKRLRTHHPPHRLTLDLRKNPGDRDPDTWNTALKRLRPFCDLLVEGWNSTDTMADYISNM